MAWKHSASGYNNHGCRCGICTHDWYQARLAYIARRCARTGEYYRNGRFTFDPPVPRHLSKEGRAWIPGIGGPPGWKPADPPEFIQGIGGYWIPGVDGR